MTKKEGIAVVVAGAGLIAILLFALGSKKKEEIPKAVIVSPPIPPADDDDDDKAPPPGRETRPPQERQPPRETPPPTPPPRDPDSEPSEEEPSEEEKAEEEARRKARSILASGIDDNSSDTERAQAFALALQEYLRSGGGTKYARDGDFIRSLQVGMGVPRFAQDGAVDATESPTRNRALELGVELIEGLHPPDAPPFAKRKKSQ